MKDDLKMTRVAYDVTTLYRILPWIFIYGDKRNPQLLAKAALGEAREFVEATDPTKDRKALLRGLTTTFLDCMGVHADPAYVEHIVMCVSSQVDEVMTSLYDDSLSGEEA